MVWNADVEIEANSVDEAIDLVQTQLNGEIADDFPNSGKYGIAEFHFGEATADYAEKY